MSFLNTPRLIFSGDFLADVPTANNLAAHYDNATFTEEDLQYTEDRTKGAWNPEGGSIFNFENCTVQKLVLQGDDLTSEEVIGELSIEGAGGKSPGKMVDLDPEQQMCSELWGVQLRILTKDNKLLLRGTIEPVAFRKLQMRQTKGFKVNGQPIGATWTSVLKDIYWEDKHIGSSRFFKELKTTTQGNKLSLNLNVFGYFNNKYTNKDHKIIHPRFTLGRVLGAIGPWFQGEPQLFVPGRKMYGVYELPQLGIFFANTNFVFDKQNKRLTIDFGASFPIADAYGTISRTDNLVLGVSHESLTNAPSRKKVYIKDSDFTPISKVNYEQGNTWLLKTGGIIDIQITSDDLCEKLSNHQLILLSQSEDGFQLVARESIDGYLLRADNFVQRLDCGETHEVKFYAYQWGESLKQGSVQTAYVDMSQLSPNSQAATHSGDYRDVYWYILDNKPNNGITFDSEISIHDGLASMKLTGNPIGYPRKANQVKYISRDRKNIELGEKVNFDFLEGQLYFIGYNIKGSIEDPAENATMPENMISTHLRSEFKIPDTPVWRDNDDNEPDNIKAIMSRYGNLYPIMSKYLIDLNDPEALIKKTEILLFSFTRTIEDPLYMPVTRDLSESKRQTIIKWLKNPVVELAKPVPTSDKISTNNIISVEEESTEESVALTQKAQERLHQFTQLKSGGVSSLSDDINSNL